MFDILCGVRRTLADNGYTLMLTDLPDTPDPQEYLTGLIGKGLADGILIHGSCSCLLYTSGESGQALSP